MIDTAFIIKYTNSLYSTPAEFAPRYDEFRDMFSSGQLRSKEWAIRELAKITNLNGKNIIVVGAWYGTLGMMIKHNYPLSSVTMLDIDPRCEKYIENMITFDDSVFAVTEDMYDHVYWEDIVINTSCEHIPDLPDWLRRVPTGTLVLLQSNNNDKEEGHINCVKSKEEFEQKANLSEVLYSDQLVTPMYTRFMIIGKK